MQLLRYSVFEDAHLVNYLRYRVREVRYFVFDLAYSIFEDAHLVNHLRYRVREVVCFVFEDAHLVNHLHYRIPHLCCALPLDQRPLEFRLRCDASAARQLIGSL